MLPDVCATLLPEATTLRCVVALLLLALLLALLLPPTLVYALQTCADYRLPCGGGGRGGGNGGAHTTPRRRGVKIALRNVWHEPTAVAAERLCGRWRTTGAVGYYVALPHFGFAKGTNPKQTTPTKPTVSAMFPNISLRIRFIIFLLVFFDVFGNKFGSQDYKIVLML